MANTCECCPISTKARECCGSHPEKGTFKILRSRKTGEIIQVCPELETDGNCAIYLDPERPDACKATCCDRLYAQGLGAS